ncbi:MAG: hypothetical protein ACOC3E_01620 [Cyanobacteriota bacterium]
MTVINAFKRMGKPNEKGVSPIAKAIDLKFGYDPRVLISSLPSFAIAGTSFDYYHSTQQIYELLPNVFISQRRSPQNRTLLLS